MQIFPMPVQIPGRQPGKFDPYTELDAPSGLFRLVIIISLIAGSVIGLETVEQFRDSDEGRVASLEQQEIAP